MTITLVLSSPPGYSETFFNSKIKGLQENGHEVILVTASTQQNYEGCVHLQHPQVYCNPVTQVVAMLFKYFSLLPYLKSIFRYIRLEKNQGTCLKRLLEKIYLNATLLKLKTDWLHFGFATMALERELVAQAIGAKMAVSFRGYDIFVYPSKHLECYLLLWKKMDQVHSLSMALLNRGYELGLSKETAYKIIPPAVDEDLFTYKKTITHTNKKLQLLTIARLHYIKGISTLINTAKLLKDSVIDFEWTIIGSGCKYNEERYLFQRLQLQLHDHIRFIGKKDHRSTLSYLNKTDFYIQPSLSEGFCNAVLEAQALGKLCVVSDADGLVENVLHEQTGWVVPKLNPEALAQKIQDVLLLPKTHKDKITANARQRVKEEFNLEKQKRMFNEFYEQ